MRPDHEGHNINETSSPGSPALWAGSFISFQDLAFLLKSTPSEFGLSRKSGFWLDIIRGRRYLHDTKNIRVEFVSHTSRVQEMIKRE